MRELADRIKPHYHIDQIKFKNFNRNNKHPEIKIVVFSPAGIKQSCGLIFSTQ